MLTKQEIFSRAYVGLKSQGWERALLHNFCCYFDPTTNRRCAWGWVDQTLPKDLSCGVRFLNKAKVGLAADLDKELLDFAEIVQTCHDESSTPEFMKLSFELLAKDNGLEIPTEDSACC